MGHRNAIMELSLWLAAIGLFFPTAAYAYIDLGTGSYILQMALAGALGAFFVLRMYFKRMLSFLGSYFSRRPKDERPADQGQGRL